MCVPNRSTLRRTRLRDHRLWLAERGASAVEYAGVIIAVVALVLVLILAAPLWGDRLACVIGMALDRAFGNGTYTCAAAEQKPQPACVLTNRSRSGSVSVSVAVNVTINQGIKVEEMSDGTYRVTDMRGSSVGVGAGVGGGAQVTWDNQSIGGYASASVGAAATGEGGQTYVVKNEKEKDDLLFYLTRHQVGDAAGLGGRFTNWLWDKADGYDPPTPQEYYVELSGKGSASAQGTASLASANGSIDLSGAVGMKVNPSQGTTTYYIESAATGEAAAGSLGIGQAGVDGQVSAMVAVTVDSESGTLKNVTTTSLLQGGYAASSDLPGAGKGPSDQAGKQVTTSLDVTSDQSRRIAEGLLQGAGILTGDTTSSAQGLQQASDAFIEASRSNGSMTVQDVSVDSHKYGADFDVEEVLKAGLGASYTDTTTTFSNGYIWTPGTGWAKWKNC